MTLLCLSFGFLLMCGYVYICYLIDIIYDKIEKLFNKKNNHL